MHEHNSVHFHDELQIVLFQKVTFYQNSKLSV